MELKNPNLLLRDESVKPSDYAIEHALGKQRFSVYQKLVNVIEKELGLGMQWAYYEDGHAWLCKVVFKKKTMFWLSIWDGFIRTGFYFNDKTRSGVLELEINDQIKKDFKKEKPIGKLLPLTIDIVSAEQLEDLSTIITYKKGLK